MSKFIRFDEYGIHLVLGVDDNKAIHLLHFSSIPADITTLPTGGNANPYSLIEVQASGMNQLGHFAEGHTGTVPGCRLLYEKHTLKKTPTGQMLRISLSDKETSLAATVVFQFYKKTPVARVWTELTNKGKAPIGLEYVSSFVLQGMAKLGLKNWQDKSLLHIPHNTWFGEIQWTSRTLPELGLNYIGMDGVKSLNYKVTGTWPSVNFLPQAAYENTESGEVFMWQIEAGVSWQWELNGSHNNLRLQLSGPTETDNHWFKWLEPGGSFTTVSAAVAVTQGKLEEGFRALTEYRRIIRRKNEDNEKLPIIFNDYMNCLMGDPTTEKLLPLIDAAAKAGCEIFCIDAGWYADGSWWNTVGEWKPSRKRFPGGIEEPINRIHKNGMVPGLWLELEVMGVDCPLAKTVPDNWFFMRHGQRVIANGRYQLDYRTPAVRKHSDSVIDRLVKDYGVGYIKMDYNINAGHGTEHNSDSTGDGLLEHHRAYIAWLKGVFKRHPKLVIENCGSGGLRMTYGFLEHHSIQSSSDQMDYKRYACIAAASPSVITPEQCAVWSYPLREGDREEVIFNMVNALLMRIHQSGHLAELTDERRQLVHDGLKLYRKIRGDLKKSLPVWPLGLPTMQSDWVALGLEVPGRMHLAVWRLGSKEAMKTLDLSRFAGRDVEISVAYPLKSEIRSTWNKALGQLTVEMPQQNTARLLRLAIT